MILLLYEAMREFGTQEIPGKASNARILEYAKEIGFPMAGDDVAWCGVFLSAMAVRAGLTPPEKGYSARAWLKWGEAVDEPETGDIVVYWRVHPDGWQGHVGIYINATTDTIRTLGGNQRDKVGINDYDADRVLGYRRLT